MARLIAAAFLLALLASCVRAPLKGPENAMRPTSAPTLADDLPLDRLADAVERQVRFMETSPGFNRFVFGERVIPKDEYLAGLKRFAELARAGMLDRDAFFKNVREEFDFYEVYGQQSWGDAFISGYYEPVVEGALKRTPRFTQPLYSTPTDLLQVHLSDFDERSANGKSLRARVDGAKVVPYYSREQIDGKGVLKGKKLELAWLDPIDAFFLQVQGSGTVQLAKGQSLRVGYAERNGQKYESIGKFLAGKIPPGKVTMQSIEAYLRSAPPEEARQVMFNNPSYVFFKKLDDNAITSMGVPAEAGRTIATDSRYFAKGMLGFLSSSKPEFDNILATEPNKWTEFSRFVLDQDVGGAITGGGRVDLFWGAGAAAGQTAGVMKQKGKLYYLAPKARH
jgi:membrane-bound lytic murein transglycosylase A